MAYFSVYFSNSGAPHTGISPTITLRDISDGSVVLNAVAMTEKGSRGGGTPTHKLLMK